MGLNKPVNTMMLGAQILTTQKRRYRYEKWMVRKKEEFCRMLRVGRREKKSFH
jgi:hypothetical protein